MLFKINTASLFHTVITDANMAAVIAAKATGYVVVAEQIGHAFGLSGPGKLDVVRKMLFADLGQSFPEAATVIEANWPKIAAVISAMVALFNFIGWAFQTAAPLVAAADPAAIPAIEAINAAVHAAQTLAKRASDAQAALDAAALERTKSETPGPGAGSEHGGDGFATSGGGGGGEGQPGSSTPQ